MSISTCARVATIALVVVGLATPVAADADEARRLFAEGRKAVAAGEHDSACALFEQSMAAEERAGTHFNLARCAIRRGALIAAARHYDRGLELIDEDAEGRDEIVRDRSALDGRIPRLVVRLAEESPPGVRVSLDGQTLSGAQLDEAVPVDPGDHVVVVMTPKGRRERVRVTVGEGETRQITVGGPVAVVDAPNPHAATHPPRDDTAMIVGGWVLIGVGVAGLVASIVSGALAAERHGRVEDLCPGPQCTTDEGFDAAQEGKTLVIVNAITLGAGLAAAAAGTTLVILADSNGDAAGAMVRFRIAF